MNHRRTDLPFGLPLWSCTVMAAGVVLLLLGITGGTLRAQTEQASITGTVTDPSSAAVPNAKVTATNVDTQVSAVTKTNSVGNYTLPYLPIGDYTVKAEKAGFKVGTVADVTLTINLTATVNIRLQVGAARQQVTVTGTPPMLQEQEASIGQVQSTTALHQLPLLGQNPYSLLHLAAGVEPGSNQFPIVNGGRTRTSDVLLDGADTRNSTTGNLNYAPPLDAVQQFKFVTSNYSAIYGRAGGGVVTAVSRSGTNQFHGNLYEFVRNNALNANSWTDNNVGIPLSKFRYNLFGGAVGGPVLIPHLYNGKDHTFFFVNLQWTRQVQPANVIATVPTALERNGDFSKTTTSNGQLITIYDPSTTRPDPNNPGAYIRDPFPGNLIPTNLISPFAQKALTYFPLPNRDTLVQNYTLQNNELHNTRNIFYRIDQNFGTRNRLYFRHGITNDNTNYGQWPNIGFPGTGTNGQGEPKILHEQSALLSDTETFTPNLLGEFKLGFNRALTDTVPRNVGFDPTTLGLPGVLAQTGNPLMFSGIDITDLSNNMGGKAPMLGAGRGSDNIQGDTNGQLEGSLTWIKGSHTITAGFQGLVLQLNVNRPNWPMGDFSFGRNYTQGPDPSQASSTAGDGIATFLLGVPTGGTMSVDRALSLTQHAYGLYVQDDWKIARNLTLNLGLRYEYQTPWTERHNQLAVFNPAVTEPITGQPGVLQFVGTPGAPAGRYDAIPQKLNLQPRIGLAYRFARNTVFRAGYGWFFLPGNGGIGGGNNALGGGFQAATPLFLGPPNPAPDTPPVGATILDSFSAGLEYPPSTGLGSSVSAPFTSWLTPSLYQWNASIQHSFGRSTVVQAAYVGTRGLHLWNNTAANAANPKYLSLGNALNKVVANPYYGIITSGALSAPTVNMTQLLLPYPQYTSVTSTRATVGNSWYNAFELTVQHRMAHGLMLEAAYTKSKLMDTVTERFGGLSSIVNPYDINQSRSLSDRDQPEVFTAGFVYELPFGQGRHWLQSGFVSKLFGDWQVSGIPTFASGTPLTIKSPCHTGLPGIGCYATRTGAPKAINQSLSQWFDTSIFSQTPKYSMGNGSRTEPTLRTPGMNTWDIGLARTQVIKERIRLQFRAEFFNSFNHPNFSAPNTSVNSKIFGEITSAANDGRNIQLALRLSF